MNIPQRDKETIIAHVLHRDRSWVIAHPNAPHTPAQKKQITALVKKRSMGMPLQHILGYAWFFGRAFTVNKHTLIPRPETEVLIEQALALMPRAARWNIVDIGCGSGCVGITLALERPHARLYTSDISAKALTVAKKNAHTHNITPRAAFKKRSLLAPWKKLFNNTSTLATPTIIVANLPYLSPRVFASALPEVKKHEPRTALLGGGADGTLLYKKLFAELARATPRTLQGIIIEIEPHQKKPLTKAFLKLFPQWRITCTKDIYNDDRILTMIPPFHH